MSSGLVPWEKTTQIAISGDGYPEAPLPGESEGPDGSVGTQ